jgi:hypothetical protein
VVLAALISLYGTHRDWCALTHTVRMFHRACIRISVGYFGREEGKSECISCDNLGNFYQENSSMTTCKQCPANTQRYIGVGTSAERISCQCSPGHPDPWG